MSLLLTSAEPTVANRIAVILSLVWSALDFALTGKFCVESSTHRGD